MKIAKRKKKKEPTLFPGYMLDGKLQSIQHGACIVGSTFEYITCAAIHGERLVCFSDNDLNPDVSFGGVQIESKAFGAGGKRCLLEIDQLNRYVQSGKSTWYVFWNYTQKHPCRGNPSIRTVIGNTSSTIAYCILIDVSLISKMVAKIDLVDGLKKRVAKMYFKGRDPFIRNYLTITWLYFEKIKSNWKTAVTLLGENPLYYSMSVDTRRIMFSVDGVVFKTNYFKMYRVLPVVPF